MFSQLRLLPLDRGCPPTIVDLIEAISPRLKTGTGRRRYVVIVRDHHQLRIELREP
jgi:hypothetical protein